MTKRPALFLSFALLCALPCAAQPTHPFGGEVLDLETEANALRAASDPAARRVAVERLFETLVRDPFLAELAPRIDLRGWLERAAAGRPFDVAAYRAAVRSALAGPVRTTADVGRAELEQKLRVLELLFRPASSAPAARGTSEAELARALGRHPTAELLAPGDTRVLALEPVANAWLVRANEGLDLPPGAAGERAALERYARTLVPAGRPGRGELRPGLAHREVGRAVLGPVTRHPAGAETADVLKGVGPTPYANNRFNSKATGSFPLPEAVRDWRETELLRRAGVAVYEPVAIVALPRYEWSESEGWRPLAVYVRRPRENLRVSDLEHLDASQKRRLLATLKEKIAAELRSVGREPALSDRDVLRLFVERLGRTAGLFQGGMGRLYFHGMLHDQNVSLLGEIVDVGNNEGVARDRAEMRRNWEKSNYAWWVRRLPEYRGMRGNVETLLFHRLAKVYNGHFAEVTGGGLSEAELEGIFREAYREGRRGVSASDPRRSLTVRPRPRTRTREERGASSQDPFARYRRPDGTLRWKELTRDGAAREGAGLAHFALALFLKELAAVAATGDRARIEEFFDGLLSTDFYRHYGLFVAGARLGEIGYARSLQRFVKPRFINEVLKTNLVLAAGLALPQIASGSFSGRRFVLSLASLGLSSAAVKAGVRGLSWVASLRSQRGRGLLARFGLRARPLARLGGWVYTAGELAVVLLLAETIEREVDERLAEARARDALGEAGLRFLSAVDAATRDEDADIDAALVDYAEAWRSYRDHLYEPLLAEEARLAARLERVARRAKLGDDERAALVERVSAHSALADDLRRRHGSVEAAAAERAARADAALADDVRELFERSNATRRRMLDGLYRGGRRAGPFLGGDAPADPIAELRQLEADLPGGPTAFLARWRQRRARARLRAALGAASPNRLQSYEDEAEVLGLAAAALRAAGRDALAHRVEEARARAARLREADARLVGVAGARRSGPRRRGARGGLREAVRGVETAGR
ncbi:MAG: hypothetical protein D6731_17100 [Planctomycetota bacterium]|nr:MAG: hypothetical protein D6731_17100 [Planctomycetota bacterium]